MSAVPTNDAAFASAALCRLNYDPDQSPLALYQAHLDWAKRHAEPLTPAAPAFANLAAPERPLRIGYVSGDLRRHPLAAFVEPILRAHDRAAFEIFCYDNGGARDAMNEQLRGLVPNWRDIAGLDDAQVAELVREDAIDILVDLSGHTPGNRLLVFARKPAPVQLSALGDVTTTGLSAMDYRLTDPWCDPEEAGEELFTEELCRLHIGVNCYLPPADLPDPGPPPCAATGRVTFASFNNLGKVSPLLLDLWALILKAVPGARLLLKTKGLGDPATQENLREHFRAAGIAPERLDLRDWSASPRAHYETFQEADIALDSFPYNDAASTCEALMMGLPVIALIGPNYASRVSYSLLGRLGLDGLAAETGESYVSIAAALASRPDVLVEIRKGLRGRMLAGTLCDAERYTRDLESAYREMWHRWCAQQAPASLADGTTG